MVVKNLIVAKSDFERENERSASKIRAFFQRMQLDILDRVEKDFNENILSFNDAIDLLKKSTCSEGELDVSSPIPPHPCGNLPRNISTIMVDIGHVGHNNNNFR